MCIRDRSTIVTQEVVLFGSNAKCDQKGHGNYSNARRAMQWTTRISRNRLILLALPKKFMYIGSPKSNLMLWPCQSKYKPRLSPLSSLYLISVSLALIQDYMPYLNVLCTFCLFHSYFGKMN